MIGEARFAKGGITIHEEELLSCLRRSDPAGLGELWKSRSGTRTEKNRWKNCGVLRCGRAAGR